MNSLFKTDLLLVQWDQLNMAECEVVARELGKRLSGPFRFHKVGTSILGERISHWGLRFPTSDEWEYACSAGSQSLFRWGNDTPDFPIPRIGTRESHQWDKHLQQNAFGLFIARNPYHWEFCKEQEFMRGGDGGHAWHAGAGTFATWLTLASAFFQRVEQIEKPVYGAYLRRAFSLNL